MELTINGQTRAFDADKLAVSELVDELGLADRRVAIEVNRRIIRRGTYGEHTVSDGDVVEIVHFVGGG